MTEDELRKTIHNVGSALSRAKKSIEKHSQLPVIPEENVNWPKYRELFDMQQVILHCANTLFIFFRKFWTKKLPEKPRLQNKTIKKAIKKTPNLKPLVPPYLN